LHCRDGLFLLDFAENTGFKVSQCISSFNYYFVCIIKTLFYENEAGSWFQWNTPYVVNTWDVNFNCNHNIPISEILIDSWSRPSSSTTFGSFGPDNIVYPREKVELLSLNYTSANLQGVVYEVFDTLGTPLGWWPFDLSGNLQAEYSVLSEGNFVTTNEIEKDQQISVYPNPTNGQQNISITVNQPIEATVRLYNSEGRLIENVFSGKLNKGHNVIVNNISSLASGIYIYAVELENQDVKHFKTIKR
jgi:hypothetical protein